MIEEDESKQHKYGVLCHSDSIGNFIVWFKTNDLASATILAKCITNNTNSLIKNTK